MNPYYQDDYVTLYHGDCREIVPQLGKFDLLLTDPPYGIGYNAQSLNYPGSTEFGDVAGDDTLEMVEWLFANMAVADDHCVFGGNNFPELLPHRGRWICWDKRVTEAADKMLGSAFELAWMNRQSGYDKMIRVLHGGVVNANGGKRQHPTEKPIRLMATIMNEHYPDAQTILDPFAGSGTTGRAAKDLQRKCTMIELEERYCEIAANRCRQEVLPL